MSVVISGALIDGAGIPMSGYHIILKSRVNTSEVVMRTVADVVTGNNGEYSFDAQVGKYCVYLKQDWRDEYCVGDISVYADSKPGTLNDFLTALDEGDLKPDVVARFEAMVAQAQQSAEDAAGSEQEAEKHAMDAEQYAAESRKNAEATAANRTATAEDVKQSGQNAASSAQSAQDAKGYMIDLATLPRILWPVFPPHGRYTKAAIIHDWLYDNALRTKAEADRIFLDAMEVLKVPCWRRWVIYCAVRIFGRGNYGKNNKNRTL